MPASTYVSSAGQIRLYDDAVQTFSELPVATYAIEFSPFTGYSLRVADPLVAGNEAVYGNHAARVERILRSYALTDRSLGALFSGDKGMGKSLMPRLLAEQARDKLGLPTILVQHSFPGLASFLDQLGEVVVVFDEFEKVFPIGDEENPQTQFLSLFDGVSTTKRLYVVSVNELRYTSDFMINRPGRFHYHMRFDYPDERAVAQYLTDQAPGTPIDEIRRVIDFSHRFDVNYDHLRAIAFELRTGESFEDIIGDLNIKRSTDRFSDVVKVRVDWQDGTFDEFQDRVDLFDPDSLQSVREWDVNIDAKFRLSDAVATREGFTLAAAALTVTDTREEDEIPAGDNVAEKVKSVLISRARQAAIDF